MPEFWFNDGTPRKVREMYFNDGTALRKIREAWFNDGSAVRKVFSATGVVDSFTAWVLKDVGYPDATVQLTIKGDGTIGYFLLNGSTAYSQIGSARWLQSGESNAGYYLRASLTGGSAPGFSSPLDTWLSLPGNEYAWQQSTGAAITLTSTLKLEFAQDTTDNIVLTVPNNVITAEGHYAGLTGGVAAAITTNGMAQATLRVSNTGVVSGVVAPGGTNTIGTQKTGANSSHYARVTTGSGLVIGTLNSWIPLSSSPIWYVSRSTPNLGTNSADVYLEIALSAGGPVVAAANFTLSAQARSN